MRKKESMELNTSRSCNSCKYKCNSKGNREELAVNLAKRAIEDVKLGKKNRINAIWLEVSGCFGEIISLLNAQEPDVIYLLKEFVDLMFLGSISGDEGETSYERILETLNTEYIFLVSGAVPLKDNGLYTTVATYNGRKITAMEAIENIAKNAKYVISVGDKFHADGGINV